MVLKIVICYARKDQDMHDELDHHLSTMKRQQLIISWSDREITPGSEWEKEIDAQLSTADIILLLISSNFMASDYCYSIEMQRALAKHKTGSTCVLPILLRPVDWEDAPFRILQILPDDARPVTQWRDSDAAWQNVVQGIRRAIKERKIDSEIEIRDNNTSRMPVRTTMQKSAALQILPVDDGKPTVEKPMLIGLAVDVSDSMKQPIIDHTGKTIKRWTSVSNAIEHFVHLGVSWVQDPETQNVLPLYHLMAYGFGFRELMHMIGRRKKPGGPVRDLLAHPNLPPLPSDSDLSMYWSDYKNHFLSTLEVSEVMESALTQKTALYSF